jgi:hypothetical protein
MVVTQKIFIVEFGQKSRFLFHHTRVTTILSPLEGWVHHIDYMFIHLSCMYRDEKWVPYESTMILNEKTRKMKNVLTITSIFKSWSFWRQAWLASSLLEQILRNYSREVPSNRPIIFVQNLTTTQPEEIGGKRSQEPRHNHIFCKSFCGKDDQRGIAPPVHNGAYSCSAKKKKKNLPQFDHACKTSWFLFQPVPICVGNLAHNFIRLSLSNEPFLLNKIMCFQVFMTYLHFCCFSCK